MSFSTKMSKLPFLILLSGTMLLVGDFTGLNQGVYGQDPENEDIESSDGNYNYFSEKRGQLNSPEYSLYGSPRSDVCGGFSDILGGDDEDEEEEQTEEITDTSTLEGIEEASGGDDEDEEEASGGDINAPEPLATYFSDAGSSQGVDPALVATIYLVENGLYDDPGDWKIGKIHSNSWATSPGGAQGPMQFIGGTWGEQKIEGPYTYSGGKWTTNKGPSDGINVNHADDAIFTGAKYLKNIGARSGLSAGSLDQDFSRGTDVTTIATILKNYNAGPGSWRDGNNWYRPSGSGPRHWGETKDKEIDNYIKNGLKIFANLGGGSGCSATSADVDIQFKPYEGELFGDGRQLTSVDAVVLHWTGGLYDDGPDGFARAIRSNTSCGAAGCSSQLFIDKEGTVWQMVPNLTTLTAHACGVNSRSIGIEIEGRGERDLLSNQSQIKAATSAVAKIASIYPSLDVSAEDPVAPSGILGHFETQRRFAARCGGRDDPGANFLQLIREGVRGSSSSRSRETRV